MRHNTVFMVALFGAAVGKVAALYGLLEHSAETSEIAITAAALATATLIIGTAAKVVTTAVEAAE